MVMPIGNRRDHFAESVYFTAGRHGECASRILEHGPSGEGSERDDLRDARLGRIGLIRAILFGDVLDHLAADALSSKSISTSGICTRSGLRKRSKVRPYSTGSMSVMSTRYETRQPAAEPRTP